MAVAPCHALLAALNTLTPLTSPSPHSAKVAEVHMRAIRVVVILTEPWQIGDTRSSRAEPIATSYHVMLRSTRKGTAHDHHIMLAAVHAKHVKRARGLHADGCCCRENIFKVDHHGTLQPENGHTDNTSCDSVRPLQSLCGRLSTLPPQLSPPV